MIEKIFIKTSHSLATQVKNTIKNLKSKLVGIILTITIPLLVYGWHILAWANRPPHLKEIVDELGATTGFMGDAIPNNSGTRFAFIQSTDAGYGVYFYDSSTGERSLLYEESFAGKEIGSPNEKIIGWSPNDSVFAYGCRSNIQICDGHSGEIIATVPTKQKVKEGLWLSSQELAFVNNNNAISWIFRSNDQWTKSKPLRSTDLEVENLVAFDEGALAWKQKNGIWMTDQIVRSPEKVWAAGTNTLLDFAFSEPRKMFLLHYRNSSGEFFSDYYPAIIWGEDRFENVTPIDTTTYNPRNVQFINNGQGYVYASRKADGLDMMVVVPGGTNTTRQFRWQHEWGEESFTAHDHAIFMEGCTLDDPSGIWKYDITSGSSECVVSVLGHPFKYVKINPTTECTFTNEVGKIVHYYVTPPVQLDGQKKHPLILGILGEAEKGDEWDGNREAFANAGAYFVVFDQRNYPPQQASDIMAVYRNLIKKQDIDSSRVYLYSSSIGVETVFKLLAQKINWRGAILFSPTELIDPEILNTKRIFLYTGTQDLLFSVDNPQSPTWFLSKATHAGIPVRLMVHQGIGHIFRNNPVRIQRIRDALNFFNEQ